ncbi:MAG: alpha/beta fold hydrolase [Candidatus Thorarchaeota archaeon]
MPYFHHKGVQIHYADVGSCAIESKKPPLILIHGAGSSHISWALQLRDLSSTNRMIAIDLSGHGKSDDVEGKVSLEETYSLEVAALVGHLELNDFILVGHSMGGGVAMSYSLNSSLTPPRALVLVDTAPVLELSKLAFGLVKEAIEDRLFIFKSQFFEDYTDTYKIKELEDRIRRANPGVLQRDLAACDKFNIADRVHNIKEPALVLVGEHDDIIHPRVAENLRNGLPNANLAIVRGAHHAPMIEQPAEFNRLLRDYLTWVEQKDNA